jgi:hypothetical protein
MSGSGVKDSLLAIPDGGVGRHDTETPLSTDSFVDEEQLSQVSGSSVSGGALLMKSTLPYVSLVIWVVLLVPIALSILRVPLPEYFGIGLGSWAVTGLLAMLFHAGSRIVLGLWIQLLKAADGLAGSDLPSYLEAALLPLSVLISTGCFALYWYSGHPFGCEPVATVANAAVEDSATASASILDAAVPLADENMAAATLAMANLASSTPSQPATKLSAVLWSFFSGGEFCVYDLVTDLILCSAICSAVFILELVLLRFGLWRFLRNHFQERILESRYRCYVVEALRYRMANAAGMQQESMHKNLNLTVEFPFVLPFKVPLLDSFMASLNARLGRADAGMQEAHGARAMAYLGYRRKLLETIQRMGMSLVAQSAGIPQSDAEAKLAAKDLFPRLCPADRDYLVPGDFQAVFGGHAATRDAYAIFDRDQDGTISKTEFRHTVISVYREQRNLATSVADASQAFHKLAASIHGLVVGGLVFVCMAIFGVQVQSLFAILLSLVLGLNVVIGDAAKRSFQGIVFLFVDHPYDVGDRVLVGALNEPDPLVVHQINMLTTVFHRWNGQELYVPNALLAGTTIFNVSRSAEQWERIDFQVLISEDSGAVGRPAIDRLGLFRDKLEAWVKGKAGDFMPTYELKPIIAGDQGKTEDSLDNLAVTLRIQCRPTLDSQKRWARHTKLLAFVKATLSAVGLELQGRLRTASRI